MFALIHTKKVDIMSPNLRVGIKRSGLKGSLRYFTVEVRKHTVKSRIITQIIPQNISTGKTEQTTNPEDPTQAMNSHQVMTDR